MCTSQQIWFVRLDMPLASVLTRWSMTKLILLAMLHVLFAAGSVSQSVQESGAC